MCSLRTFFVLTTLVFAAAATDVFAQQPQKMVLWEEFTQWNCPPCAAINPWLTPMLRSHYQNAISIWYHGSFPDANDDPMYAWDQTDFDGNSYYGVNAEPECRIDGVEYTPAGGYYAGSPQDTSFDLQQIATDAAEAASLSLTITETPDASGNTNVQIVALSTVALTGNYTLRVAVVNAEIDSMIVPGKNIYRNGETSWINVVQAMLPDYNGTAVSFKANTPQTFNFTYSPTNIMPTGNAPHPFIVAWVQYDVNQTVVNAATDLYIAPAPATLENVTVGNPGTTAPSNTWTFTNNYAMPVTLLTSLSVSAPPAWSVTYNVGKQNYASLGSVDTTIVPAGGTANIAVNFTAPKPGGVANTTLQCAIIAGDTLSNQTFVNYYATNDLNTLVMDVTGQTTRASVYENALAANHYGQAYGTLPEALLIPNGGAFIAPTSFPNLQNIICVTGFGYLASGTIYYFSPYDYFTPLGAFMSNGGNVFLTSEVAGGVAQSDNYTTAVDFFKTYMHALDNVETGTIHNLVGVSGDPVSGNGSGYLESANEAASSPSQTNVVFYSPDAIATTDAEAIPIFNFANANYQAYSGDSSICGVRVQDPGFGYKAVYMTFTMEAMANTQNRNKLMANIMNWFSSPSAVWEDPAPAATPSLLTNYPNPFTGTTTIQFNLPKSEDVMINVYDMTGTLVGTVANGMMQSGTNSVNFDAANLPAGVYEYRLSAASGIMTGLMSVVK